MRSDFVGIVSVILIVIAITCMGCTSQTTTSPNESIPVPTASGTSTANSPSLAASPTLPQIGSIVSSTSIFSKNYNWYEYQATTAAGGKTTTMDMKTERSTGNYQGKSAIHYTITETSSADNFNMVFDTYADPSSYAILGGTMTTTFNGQKTTTAISPIQISQQAVTNFEKAAPLTFAGTEPVSVPAGSYPAANKYTRTVNETTITHWSASGIPVPVKTITSFPSGSITSELVGWG
jgi:phospholipase C